MIFLNELDLKVLGEALRKVRKKRGLRLVDLEDDQISFATISSIERGVPTVKPQNRLYYCQKLGFDVSQLPSLIRQENGERNKTENLLFLIETCIRLDCDAALEQLRKLQSQGKEYYLDKIYYLKGLCYVKKNKLKKRNIFFSNPSMPSKRKITPPTPISNRLACMNWGKYITSGIIYIKRWIITNKG